MIQSAMCSSDLRECCEYPSCDTWTHRKFSTGPWTYMFWAKTGVPENWVSAMSLKCCCERVWKLKNRHHLTFGTVESDWSIGWCSRLLSRIDMILRKLTNTHAGYWKVSENFPTPLKAKSHVHWNPFLCQKLLILDTQFSKMMWEKSKTISNFWTKFQIS